jgi:hypothetical protein
MNELFYFKFKSVALVLRHIRFKFYFKFKSVNLVLRHISNNE